MPTPGLLLVPPPVYAQREGVRNEQREGTGTFFGCLSAGEGRAIRRGSNRDRE